MKLKAEVLTILILVLLVYTCSYATESAKGGPSGTGKKKLRLFAKNPATWAIVKNGGSGALVYGEGTGTFSLTATGLPPRSPFALIRYTDSPPRGEILARGASDERGRVQLAGNWRNWTGKFWLVAGEDVGGGIGEAGTLKGWRPEKYLFEEKPLGVPCHCPEPEEP